MANSVTRVSWIHELFFSLNLAWLAVWYELMRPTSVIYKFGGWQMRHRYWRRISAGSEPYGVFEQFFWALIFGMAILVFFRLSKWIWTPGSIFRAISGIIAIAGFPLVALYFFPLSLTYSIHVFQWRFPRASVALAIIEIAAVIVCGALYLVRKWRLPTIPTISLLVAHFGLWAWLTGSWVDPMLEMNRYGVTNIAAFISIACYVGLPVLGFLASLSWGEYVRTIGDALSVP